MKNTLAIIVIALLFSSCGEQEIVNPPPYTYELKQNYPNPFADSTVIEYGVPFVGSGQQAPHVKIVIYDRFLNRQATLVDNPRHPAGKDTVVWYGKGINGIPVPRGIYYIELQQITFSDEDPKNVLLRVVAFKN